MTYEAKLQAFCTVLTNDELKRLEKQSLNCTANRKHAVATVYGKGRVYDRIAKGGSSIRYFVRKSDGAIFASATWKAPNLNRQYGTLDTIDQFFWGNFNAEALKDSTFTMKPTANGYFTAIPTQ